mmetsp:Transcript_11039/g.30994  ORF Transcript_11039/g.30994 Transcript_11039/m.30994 type:complete len:419 (+) Transcript_11039:207-1463(+)
MARGHGHHHHHATHAKDRTLVLRILVPSLRTALRDKMAALDQTVATEHDAARSKARVQAQQAQASLGTALSTMSASAGDDGRGGASAATILDLEGVNCAPLANESTLWSFRCDGMTYPARLCNLPCPVEVHKTHDHASYYKCSDVGQMLIVYEDMTHLEESESVPGYKVEGYPSYYHSGITPPLQKVVERRFDAREHRSVAPPRSEISEVEKELKSLIDQTEKGAGKGKGKGKGRGKGSGSVQGKAIEEVVDEIVDYEPWMDENGAKPYGIAFDEKDIVATKHPEIWLDPKEIKEVKEGKEAVAAAAAAAAAVAAASSAAADREKKTKKAKDGTKKKKKKKPKDGAPAVEEKHVKKGIPSLKTREAQQAQAASAASELDEVDFIASQMASTQDGDDLLGDFDDLFNFDGDDLGDMNFD